MFWPCETRTSTCRSFATISSGLYRFLAITVLLDVKDIPQVGPLQWGWISTSMTGAMFSVASNGGVHAGIVGIACIAFRFEQYRASVPSAPKPIKKQARDPKSSQPRGLSFHQSSIQTPTLS